jgi:general stress protein 26
MNQVQPRPLAERRKAAMERLRSNSNLWLATASDGRGPHLIPLAYWWDGSRLTTATFEGSRTLKNVRAQPKVRAAIGSTGDVLMIDATATIATVADIADIAEVAERYAQASGNDPQSVPGFVYIQLVPERIQLWKGVAEFTGRTVVRRRVVRRSD